MPGGPFGSVGTNDSLPPVASLALVFGGLILLTRVWLGFLRHLNRHHGFPVKRVVLVVAIWAVPLLLAPPLFSRDVYTYAAQGEMMSHHINPYAYGPEVLGATPFNQMADTVWSGTESPYGPTFLSGRRRARPGLRPPDPGRPGPAPAARGRGHRAHGGRHPDTGPIAQTRPGPRRPDRRGSPLVLLSLVAGAHNDALMVGLLMAGLAVAKRFGTVPGRDPVCAGRGGEVPRRSRRAVPRLGLGGPGGLHPAPHRAHRSAPV